MVDEEQVALSQFHEQLENETDKQIYNPDQDKEQVMQIRTGYNNLLQQTREQKNEMMLPTSDSLGKLVEKANNLMNKVRNTTEATLDSNFLLASASIGADRMKNLYQVKGIGLEEYLSRIEPLLRNEDSMLLAKYDFRRLSVLASEHGKRAFVADFLNGPIELLPTIREPKKRRAEQEKVTKSTSPEIVAVEKDDSQNETTMRIINVFTTLEKVAPINFYSFIVDADSFSNTVENLFYLSFLIKDFKAKLFMQDDELFVTLCSDEEDEEEAEHLILDISIEKWKEIIQKNQIRGSVIKSVANKESI